MATKFSIAAHFAAIFIGSFVIVAGIGAIEYGIVGLMGGAARWIGGFLIWIIIALVSLPLTVLLRFVGRRFFNNPSVFAMVVGVIIGLILIPVLHPAMTVDVSFSTHAVSLLIIHGLAGLLCGLSWYRVEYRKEGQSI